MDTTHQLATDWEDLPGSARNLLASLARREQAGKSTSRPDIASEISDGRIRGVTNDTFWDGLTALKQANFVQGGQLTYHVTESGRRELVCHWCRIGAAIKEYPADQHDSVVCCPSCDTPIGALTTSAAAELSTKPCDCVLTEGDLDPAASSLLSALDSIDDNAAANHIRQALYLLLPRADD